MIVASLLLILVAVTLLVLGLTGGSSNLLISSIVASLLAAVALVIGARQSAGARRAAAEQTPAEPPAPEFVPAEAAAEIDDFDDFPPPPGPVFAAESEADRRETVQFAAAGARRPDDFDEQLFTDEPDAYEAGYESGPAYEAGRHDVAGASGAPADVEPEPVPVGDADYERAAGAIHAARSEHPDEHSWRRGDNPVHAEPAVLDDDFDEPAEDDPADEPLPQTVRPADAVRLAQLDAEVLVVDGRPRYHLPACSHLVGRLTEPIPVNEAVDLGFSPCGLCRPVDHLVAAATRH